MAKKTSVFTKWPLVGAAFLLVWLLGLAQAQSLAEQYPPRAEDLQPTSGFAPQFRREVAEAERERVPLRVDWGDNAIERSEVTFGVPFGRGALPDAANIRVVDDRGEQVAAAFRTTATWDGPDGPVRWALGHAALQRGRAYFLEFGAEVEAGPPPALEIAEDDERIAIDTGALQVVLSRRSPTVLDSVSVGGETLVSADRSREHLPKVVDGSGAVYTAGGASEGLKAEVVERGPGRAAVRREGWYVNADGERFCQFITYTYFYGGQATVRHDHTLVVAFDTNANTIRDIALPIPLETAADAEAVFAADGSPDGAAVALPAANGPHSLVQKEHDAWELAGPAGTIREGSRAGGWFGLSDGRRGAFAGLTHFWQQFPAELEVDGRVLRVHLWPARGVEPLDFRPSSRWQLGDEYPGDAVFHQSHNWYGEGLDEMTQGYGVGKTHSLHLNFFAEGGDVEARGRVRAQAVEPVLALPAPEYVCSTDAFFGRMRQRDPERFPEVEALIDSVVETYYAQRENNEQYGWIHFGDVYNTGGLWRRWGSMFYGFPNVMPRLYLRSGLRETWDFHRVNARHITDIDICHLDNEEMGVNVRRDFVGAGHRGKVKGMRYGGDGGIAHYAGDPYAVGPDHHFEFMALDYYINGNLRAWEVANYYLEVHAAARDKHGSMLAYAHRGTGGALRLFSEAYWATWDPEYLSIMRQLADLMYGAQEELGVTRRDDVYMNPAKILYYQITGDERMRDLFLNDMDALARQRNLHGSSSGGRGATLSGLAHAYWFTGDEKYLPFLAWQLEELKEKGIGGLRGNFLGRHATHGYQLPQVAALLTDVEELPEPEGPAVPETTEVPLALRSNWAFYLRQDADEEFTVELDVNLYESYRRNFQNRGEWIAQLEGDERPAFRVIGPDGDEVKRIELTSETTDERLRVTVPADGKTGTYALVPASLAAPRMVARVVRSSLDKCVAHAGENWTAPFRSRSFFFTVPTGTRRFSIDLKTAMLRTEVQYGVRTPDDDLVAEGRWLAGAQPRRDWETIELDAHAPEEDEVWSLTFLNAGETFLRFDGIPGYVASAPEEAFIPDPALRQPLPPVERPADPAAVEYVDADLPWGGRAAYLGEALTLRSPGEPRELMGRERGTIELWVKTAEPHSMVSDRTFLDCGTFSLQRRLDIATYPMIGGNRFQRYFAVPNNRWTHLAFTWKPSDEEGADLEIALFADGVKLRERERPGSDTWSHVRVPEDWPGESLSVRAGFYVAGLRVSDIVRYEENFTRPQAPFEPDQQTRVLCPFDGSGEAWVFGERVAID